MNDKICATFILAASVAALGGCAQGLPVGDTAPDFQLRDLSGNTVMLSKERGQPILLCFWAAG